MPYKIFLKGNVTISVRMVKQETNWIYSEGAIITKGIKNPITTYSGYVIIPYEAILYAIPLSDQEYNEIRKKLEEKEEMPKVTTCKDCKYYTIKDNKDFCSYINMLIAVSGPTCKFFEYKKEMK